MPYQMPFHELVYPDESGQPRSALYRIAFTDTLERLAVIHIRHVDAVGQNALGSSIIRDQILNRILEHDLKGVPVNWIRLVVETPAAINMFAIEVDIDDYIARGNPFVSSHATTAGGMLRESIAIRSDAVIAGSARMSTAHAVPEVLAPEIQSALN